MIIRPAIQQDYDSILDIFMEVIAGGETFVLPRDLSREHARNFWCGGENKVFVGEDDGKIAGSYYLKPNHPAPGNHVANAGYIVAPAERGKHIGRSLAEHSIAQARGLGFRAMQFNFVVATNRSAIRLWQHLGFRIIGTLPGVFQHPTEGYVDAHIMFLELLSNV